MFWSAWIQWSDLWNYFLIPKKEIAGIDRLEWQRSARDSDTRQKLVMQGKIVQINITKFHHITNRCISLAHKSVPLLKCGRILTQIVTRWLVEQINRGSTPTEKDKLLVWHCVVDSHDIWIFQIVQNLDFSNKVTFDSSRYDLRRQISLHGLKLGPDSLRLSVWEMSNINARDLCG